MWRCFCPALFVLMLSGFARSQQLEFAEAASSDPVRAANVLPRLARQILAEYKHEDRFTQLDNLYRLRLVAGQYAEAQTSIAELRSWLSNAHDPRADWINRHSEIYARAKELSTTKGLPFSEAYAQVFRDAFSRFSDLTAATVVRPLAVLSATDFQGDFERGLAKQKGKSTIALAEAVQLIRDFQMASQFRETASLLPALVAEDDERRYVTEKEFRIRAPDGGTLCGVSMRPRASTAKLSTLFKFTIYVEPAYDLADARLSAGHGYAGVVGYVRGKACSPDKPVAYERDGADSSAMIDWIAAQPWSDGRVGMYSGSYSGFTQWATAKHMPKALKGIMAGAAAAPGLDVPMEGNVFWNFSYPWLFYTLDRKDNDDATYNDHKRWQRIDHEFYVTGRAYRELDKIDGTPNATFDQWISHPSYDAYWQSMIPYGQEFTRINIPVLQTAGYYGGGPGAAVYYFGELQKANPKAEDYLVIGPYHHFSAQYGVFGLLGNEYDSIGGMTLDPVARIDLERLRFDWFDYLFKGARKPSLLQDKVNYQVTGANVWKHAPTFAAMGNQSRRFYLTPVPSGTAFQLSEKKPGNSNSVVPLKVDLADRSDVDRQAPGGGVLDDAVDSWNGVEFISDSLPQATEMSGLFSSNLDFHCNKKDFDFEIDLYEQTLKGKYVQLTSYWTRASYVENRNERHLLTPGKRQHLQFVANRLMSRQFEKGSRLVVILRVIKESGRQINYGSGKEVSTESVGDAGAPLEINWFSDSYVDVPVSR